MARRRLDKKGIALHDADQLLFWLLIVVPIAALLLGFMVAWTTGLKNSYIPEGLESKVYETRLIYSPECFAYKDRVTGRVYTGVIDISKFNDNVLEECVPLKGFDVQALGAELVSADGQSREVRTDNWDRPSEKIITNSYVVDIRDSSGGLIEGVLTFFHKK